MSTALIITAAGSSTRLGTGRKKEFYPLEQGTVLSTVVSRFMGLSLLKPLIITIPAGLESETIEALGPGAAAEDFRLVTGGANRQASVLAGLRALKKAAPTFVLIHDAARPWIDQTTIKAVIAACHEYGAAAPGIAVTDAIKLADTRGSITEHLNRDRCFAVQTPQCFRYQEILAAHEKAAGDQGLYVDDTEIYQNYVGTAYIVPGSRENRKITHHEDLE